MSRKTHTSVIIHPFFASNKLLVVLSVAVCVAAGSLVAVSRADTPFVSAEPELGSVSAPATVITDSAASAGKDINFTTASSGGGTINSTTPCGATPAPAQWKHVIVLMFENKQYSSVIGSSSAPYISGLATKCGSYASWKDADFKVNGSSDGTYVSKPNYATLTSGVSPSVHGLKDDSYSTTSSVDNIFNRLSQAGKMTKSYESGTGGSCASSNFSGAYHDAMRYYTNLGGQSLSPTTYCNTHDVPIADLTTDINSGNLPAYSLVLPTNSQNMHDVSVSTGDSWAQTFLTPILDSAQYKSGDTAIFFLWDEDTPIPNVLIAPSIVPGSHPTVVAGSNPISHFSALRTHQEMLGVTPLLGDTGQAPSLLNYFNGH